MNILDRIIIKMVFYYLEKIQETRQMGFLIKRIADNMCKQIQPNKNNNYKKIKKYEELCHFVNRLSDSYSKGKNCLIESITIFLICKIKRIYVDFHIGIQKSEKFGAHAWTELADRKEKAYLRRIYEIII